MEVLFIKKVYIKPNSDFVNFSNCEIISTSTTEPDIDIGGDY